MAILGQDSAQIADDAKVTDLRDGYVRVETPVYVIEVPKGWNVTQETPWGQRKVYLKKDAGELGVMTAPPSEQSWERLYEASLYFILREERGEPTPYKVTKTKNGLEAMEFSVKDKEGFAHRRYLLLKDPDKGLLALSVTIPSKEKEKEWFKHFERMTKTAKFLD